MSDSLQETLGKKLGKQAFYLCFVVGAVYSSMLLTEFITNAVVSFKAGKPIVVNLQGMGAITLFVGSIMGIVWGSKASSNFAPNLKLPEKPIDPGVKNGDNNTK